MTLCSFHSKTITRYTSLYPTTLDTSSIDGPLRTKK